MNREIKFRGKSIMNNTCGDWLYSSGIKYGDDVELMYCDEDTSEEWNYIDKETLGQYTGLDDKNGKEIYEGDIVLLDCYHYEEPAFDGEFKVIYDVEKGMWLLVDLENKDRNFTFGEIRSYYKAETEVIGNEFDNPELLGGE